MRHDQNYPEVNPRGRKRILRVLAVILAVALILPVMTNSLFNVIVGYAEEGNPLSRIYDLLTDTIDSPESYDDYYQLATIAIGKGEYETALEHLDKCKELADPENKTVLADLWLKIASVHALMLDYDQALTCLDTAIEKDDTAQQAYLLRAQIQIEKENYQAAALDLEQSLELKPEDTSLRVTLAQIYENLAQYENARICYEALYKALPEDDSHLLNALRCKFLEQDYEGALEGYDAYLKDKEKQTEVADGAETDPGLENTVPPETQSGQDPLMANAYFMRASCLLQLAKYSESAAGYQLAMDAGYDSALCLEQMVTGYYAAEQFQEAVTAGEKLLETQATPLAADVLYQHMGASEINLEDYESAEKYLALSIEKNPQLAGSYYFRGVALLSTEQYEKAVADFTESIAQKYLEQFCYYNRGVCYVQLMDYDNALNDMEKTLDSGDDQTLKDAATNVLWQLASYYESQNAQKADVKPITETENDHPTEE